MSYAPVKWSKWCPESGQDHNRLYGQYRYCPNCTARNPSFLSVATTHGAEDDHSQTSPSNATSPSHDPRDLSPPTDPIPYQAHESRVAAQPHQHRERSSSMRPPGHVAFSDHDALSISGQSTRSQETRSDATGAFASIHSRQANSIRQSHNKDRHPAPTHAGSPALGWRKLTLEQPKALKKAAAKQKEAAASLYRVFVELYVATTFENKESTCKKVGKGWADLFKETDWLRDGERGLAAFLLKRGSTSVPKQYLAPSLWLDNYIDTYVSPGFRGDSEVPVRLSPAVLECGDLETIMSGFSKSKQDRCISVVIELEGEETPPSTPRPAKQAKAAKAARKGKERAQDSLATASHHSQMAIKEEPAHHPAVINVDKPPETIDLCSSDLDHAESSPTLRAATPDDCLPSSASVFKDRRHVIRLAKSASRTYSTAVKLAKAQKTRSPGEKDSSPCPGTLASGPVGGNMLQQIDEQTAVRTHAGLHGKHLPRSTDELADVGTRHGSSRKDALQHMNKSTDVGTRSGSDGKDALQHMDRPTAAGIISTPGRKDSKPSPDNSMDIGTTPRPINKQWTHAGDSKTSSKSNNEDSVEAASAVPNGANTVEMCSESFPSSKKRPPLEDGDANRAKRFRNEVQPTRWSSRGNMSKKDYSGM